MIRNLLSIIILSWLFVPLAYSFPNEISPVDAKQLFEKGKGVIIDVREKSEVDLGMAKSALWYPKSSIDNDFDGFKAFLASYLSKNIILYCRSGHRASLVIEKLAKDNIKALNMLGYQGWVDAGLPIKQSP